MIHSISILGILFGGALGSGINVALRLLILGFFPGVRSYSREVRLSISEFNGNCLLRKVKVLIFIFLLFLLRNQKEKVMMNRMLNLKLKFTKCQEIVIKSNYGIRQQIPQ